MGLGRVRVEVGVGIGWFTFGERSRQRGQVLGCVSDRRDEGKDGRRRADYRERSFYSCS